MTIFLIFFFLYLVLRVYMKQRQRQVEPVVLVGMRYGISPESVRSISIVGMAGIALLIVILTIMGVRLAPEHIAYLLTLGVITMSVQYYPLVLIGEKGITSLDTSVVWSDVAAVEVGRQTAGALSRVRIEFAAGKGRRSFSVFLRPDQVEAFHRLLKEYAPAVNL